MLAPNKNSFLLVRRQRNKEYYANNQNSVFSSETQAVEDDNKRNFLKILGITGLGVAVASMIPEKAQALVIGSSPTTGVVGVKDSSNNRVNPAKEDGNLASIKTNTDPFLSSGGGGYIRQDSTGTIAKESGGNLAAINTQLQKLQFDGSNNLMTTGGSTTSAVGIKNTSSVQVNPAEDESVTLLRRMVKFMESQAAFDKGNRQRITIDAIGPATNLTTTVPVSGTVTASVSGATIAAGTAAIGSVTIDSHGRQMFADPARNAYANGIRQNLVWS